MMFHLMLWDGDTLSILNSKYGITMRTIIYLWLVSNTIPMIVFCICWFSFSKKFKWHLYEGLLFFIPFYSVFLFLSYKSESLVNSLIVLMGSGLIIATYPLGKLSLNAIIKKNNLESKSNIITILSLIIYCFSGFICYWSIIHLWGFNYRVE